MLIRVNNSQPSLLELINSVHSPDLGAIISMCGYVRNHNLGFLVNQLYYEAYEPMAEKLIAEIIAETEKSYSPIRVAVHHRVGSLQIGDLAVAIAVGAPHRKEAFRACETIIEKIKKEVPIWKKESRENGSVWVGF